MKPAQDEKGKSVRLLRIGEQVRHAMAALLARREIRNPVLENTIISVSEVRVTPDLRQAIVFVHPLGGPGLKVDEAAVLAALKENSRWLRGEIAKTLATKYTPDLTFRLDESFDAGAKIDAILRSPHVARDLNRP
ncbi:30S ribosome-binding factor RbfA [Polymorphobacter sp. PAMC 29334]|uniref:30S ribosome-binding factor RbfA n=1 Tax=Polymorphobacter sp. PAMC 29334 TaxID=2862331 RepID=UPI001C755C30|nr:30S ribosome-binding factor RbfA [Polymorphobacter sp. PAMC 29334]QYE35842.1 30S ribosome-binding factor RbfA [Polymorphobacter sp. PAMC 29334]